MNSKEPIAFTQEQETLLIPLYAKAQANPILRDLKARQILDSLQYDFRQLKVPQKTAVTLWIRARQMDIYTERFLTANPNALMIHLGCGLDSRCLRVPNNRALWIDLDVPEVIDLRRRYFSESSSYRMIASSVNNPGWMNDVPLRGRPTFVVAEGLFMYLGESEVRSLIGGLQDEFPGCELVFDAFSKLAANRIQRHPSIQKTGASVQWGIDDPREIEGWGEGITFREEWFFGQSPDIRQLTWFLRFMFHLAARIPAAQRAHRFLRYTL